MEQKKTMPTPIALIIGIVIGVALTLAGLFLYKIGTEGVPAMSNGGEASQSENVSSAVPEGETSQLENTSSAESENADSSAPAGGGDTAFYPCGAPTLSITAATV